MSLQKEFFQWEGRQCWGNPDFLLLPKAVVLNSRQSLQPTANLPWVRGTVEAVEAAAGCGSALITSLGINTWEICCWLAALKKAPQILLAFVQKGRDPSQCLEETLKEFELDPNLVCFVFIESKGSRPKRSWLERDSTALSLADSIFPVSIRPSGKMEELIRNQPTIGNVNETFRVEWKQEERNRIFRFDQARIEREVDPLFDGCLFHWTRSANGPWPGETRVQYYRAIFESGGEYCRSARKTLDRMVSEKRLRSSSWRIRGGHPVVSFSSLPPSQAVKLMRWRKRYNRFTVEPYGVAIKGEASLEIGIRPVAYSENEEETAGIPEHLRQSPGVKGDWPSERECRSLGDLDLAALPEESWSPLDLSHFVLNQEDGSGTDDQGS